MKFNHKKAWLVGAVVGGAMLIGGGALALADPPLPTPGSIKAPVEDPSEPAGGSPGERAQDREERAALAKLATVTQQEAAEVATDLVPGTISEIQLDEEDGFVMWEVDVIRADGTKVEVLIDAGDATNTAQQVEDADEADIVGAAKVPDGTDGPAGAAALAELATITAEEAAKVATDAVPGTVNTVTLDDEDGFVVWEVDVIRADGAVVEVLVDAVDASILAQEID